MKLTLVAAVSVLSTLASGLALPDLTPRSTVIHPSIAILIKQDYPTTAFPPTNTAETSRSNQLHEVRTLLGYEVPPCTGTCTFSFPTAATTATGSAQVQLFSTIQYPQSGNTWNSKPSTNQELGAFQTSTTGAATVMQNFGLTFACPTTNTKLGFETHPVNDNDSVTWDVPTGGFILTCG
ncbi:hypothetical protein B9Z19DRAFT_652823 [Tuber borchii]|uniref:Ubiquitin 3 binding protein But2 C-terminal domain-containing protein n=1 Tax=Tuber borchii TaxID=42251 RepID=A0A2T7A057_TUBBO|nr:hypothetical protein B9Z19DRAFT_652823 [Tuber borchii]